MLKRKNEDSQSDPQTKRVAMDAEIVEADKGESPTSKEVRKPTPISSHKVYTEEANYVHFRMLCPVREAALVVGKGGERINYIKEKSGAHIQVSENIKGVYERVINVKGSSEKVAKAFGLITRTIIDEPETPSSAYSKQYVLRLLVPHPVIGYVIGKGGSKFREIEEKSAAKLKASETMMPMSNDRCLSVSGVPDAIHIAAYYIGQTIYENKKNTSKTKNIFYTPGHSGYNNMNQFGQYPGQFQMGYNQQFVGMMPMGVNYMNIHGPNVPKGPNGGPQGDGRNLKPYNNMAAGFSFGKPMAAPMKIAQNNHISTAPNTPPSGTLQPPITLLGLEQQQTLTQEIYISNDHVGSVIGKGGKNIKEIRDNSGSQIKVQDPDPNNPNERKIVLIGGANNNQMAMYLINNRIEMDKQKNLGKLNGNNGNGNNISNNNNNGNNHNSNSNGNGNNNSNGNSNGNGSGNSTSAATSTMKNDESTDNLGANEETSAA